MEQGLSDVGICLILGVARFQLMSHCQYQHHVILRQPPILCDITVASACKHQFTPIVFGDTPEVRVICQELECSTHAEQLLSRSDRVFGGNEIEESLEICQRPSGYFDTRQVRALGRRDFLPETRVSR